MRNRWLAKGAEAGQRDKGDGIGPHSGSKAQVTEAEMNTYMAFLIDLTKAGVQATAVPLVTTSEKCTRRWRSWVGLRNRKGKEPYASAGLLESKVILKCQY